MRKSTTASWAFIALVSTAGVAQAQPYDAVSQFELGVRHAEGRGVEKSDAEAVKWWRLAAEQGHAEAQYNMGIMYTIGHRNPRDLDQARRWFGFAAAQGHEGAIKALRDLQ